MNPEPQATFEAATAHARRSFTDVELAAARISPASLPANDTFCLEEMTGEKKYVTWLDEQGGYLCETNARETDDERHAPWANAPKDARFAIVLVRLTSGGFVRSVLRVSPG